MLEGLWLWKSEAVYRDLYHFWSKIFAVNFGMGVVSGLVMAYQFGTNWSHFSDFAGSVIGPLLAYEVLTAFFLEAGFLGVMLFGWNRVGRGLHFFATLHGGARHADLGLLDPLVQQLDADAAGLRDRRRPRRAGRLVGGDLQSLLPLPARAHGRSPPISRPRSFVGAAGAWHLLRGSATTRRCARCSRWRCGCCCWWRRSRSFVGDLHGLNTLKHQPAKIAAMEGHWENSRAKACR